MSPTAAAVGARAAIAADSACWAAIQLSLCGAPALAARDCAMLAAGPNCSSPRRAIATSESSLATSSAPAGRSFMGRTTGTRGSIASAVRGASVG